ncbi:hypothetical protein [Enterobacter hormaechei]|nr:hypothetical protein [Enterobacter hormaechei]
MVQLRHPRCTGLQQLPVTLLGGKKLGRDRVHTVLDGKFFRPRPGQQHMRALFHHQTRGQHRITQTTDARYRARFQGDAVHHAGIQLVRFIARKDRANTGIKQRTLLQQTHRFGHHVQRAVARFQHPLACFHNDVQRIDITLLLLGTELCTGDCPGTAMNCDNRFTHFASPISLAGCFFYKYHYRRRIFR